MRHALRKHVRKMNPITFRQFQSCGFDAFKRD
jgi:hypothetical protein